MRRRKRRDPVPALFLSGLLAVAALFGGLSLWDLSPESTGEEPSRVLESAPPSMSDEEEGEDSVPVAEERVRVEVLNGSGVPGVAALARDHLRDQGFDVVFFGNAPSFDREGSVVLDRVGSPGLAEGVARALGIAEVETEPDSSLLLDVSVILGQDWHGVENEEEVEEVRSWATERPWWHFRRIFRDGSR